MRKLFGLSAVAIVISMLMFACNSDNVVSTSGSNVIRPLAIGNYWIYSFDSSDVSFFFYFDTMKVVSYENLNGNQAYGVKINSNANNKLYFINKEDGQYYFGRMYQDSTSTYFPLMYVKYPVNINDTIVGPFDGKMKCLSLDASFNGFTGCVEIKEIRQNNDLNYHEYWKPGIGLVGAEYDYNGKHYMNKLKDYHIQ